MAAVALVQPAAAAQEPAAAGRGSHRATQQALDALVEHGIPGVTAQVRERYRVWGGTAGVGDIRTQRPRGLHDRYRVGSITKTFVATTVLQLEAEGKLRLDDAVDAWLPGLVKGNGHDGTKISIRQLLNHTSGIYNYTADPELQSHFVAPGFFEHRFDTWTPKELVEVAMRHKPAFEPGTGWSYSNTNYALAGMIIEKATGKPYGEEIRDRIIRPLRLRATSVPGTDPGMPWPSGRGYSKLWFDNTSGPTYDVTEFNPSGAWAAGEMISDSADLNRFYSALMRGRLLPPAQLKEMLTAVPVDAEGWPEAGYGLGLIKHKLSCGTELWGHSGGIHGSLSVATTTKDGRHSVAFNLNGDWGGDTQSVLEAEYCGVKPEKRSRSELRGGGDAMLNILR
ncbi:serine hydrolase domain-containing protein [Streptomyces sp. PR69]|uniref:serine hydrolase domain-containing protein n=1 Tax=Streptomyces sp. PR69 TaxID=2984950 RepID=UPI002264B041|nr:serine hydrolase domain-containing protein [Streptomyces sp. PR69]